MDLVWSFERGLGIEPSIILVRRTLEDCKRGLLYERKIMQVCGEIAKLV